LGYGDCKMNTLAQRLSRETTLLADGATGTMLQRVGLPVGEAPERWTLERPDAIRDLARQYAAAGADLVYTNTFGANRLPMTKAGLADQLTALNTRAVALAREGVAAAKSHAFVLASLGPTGEMIEPYGELSEDAAREAFLEQARVLAAAGVDGFVCETFSDLNEALLCVAAVKSVTTLPVIASIAVETSGRTMMGVTPADAVAQLTAAGAAAAGVNCSVGPDVVEQAVRAMRAVRPEARLLAKPNAGLPKVVNGQAIYDVLPAALGDFARRMRALGVAVVGGCCGTTPDHIRAMRQVLDAR
jgi:5-methyltetrahydrofolate--homocysteine methyltransferase